VANLCVGRRVLPCMIKRSLALLAVLAAGLVATVPAQAQTPVPQPGPQANGIIAILIGLAQAPFTPPIGSDKGS